MSTDPRAAARRYSFPLHFLRLLNGRFVPHRDHVLAVLDDLHALGVGWVMAAGINCLFPYDCDPVEEGTWFCGELDRRGMRVSSHHCVLPTVSLPRDDAVVALRANLARTVEWCAPFRPRCLVLHPGNVWGLPDYGDGLVSALREAEAVYGTEGLLGEAAANLRHLCAAAAAHGMGVAVETMWEPLPLQHADHLRRLIGLIGMDNAGYCIDSGHLHLIGQSAADWITAVGPRVLELHLHDNDGCADAHLPPGFGTVSWLPIVRALAGYTGPITFECGPWPGMPAQEGLRRVAEWWECAEGLAHRACH